jgi:hypothetical protein
MSRQLVAIPALFTLCKLFTASPAIASTELAQIWQSRDCVERHQLVATVSADVVAQESEKFGGCLKIEYFQDISDQAFQGIPTEYNPAAAVAGGAGQDVDMRRRRRTQTA